MFAQLVEFVISDQCQNENHLFLNEEININNTSNLIEVYWFSEDDYFKEGNTTTIECKILNITFIVNDTNNTNDNEIQVLILNGNDYEYYVCQYECQISTTCIGISNMSIILFINIENQTTSYLYSYNISNMYEVCTYNDVIPFVLIIVIGSIIIIFMIGHVIWYYSRSVKLNI